ncbi:MAG: hypothetical protein ACTTKL_06205 [Treponema sp.]
MKKCALLFTQDTKNLPYIAEYLFSDGWQLLAAGAAAEALKHNKIPFTPEQSLAAGTSAYDYASSLLLRILQSGQEARNGSDGNSPSLVCVNILPEYRTAKDFFDGKNCIDLRTVSIIRSAANNYQNVLILTDPADYKEAVIQLKTGDVQDSFRLYLAGKALNMTAAHDAAVSDSILRESNSAYFPNYYLPAYEKQYIVRHGMNPHQKACFYTLCGGSGFVKNFKKLQGKELTFGIIRNVYVAWQCVSIFTKTVKNPFTVETTDAANYTFATQFTPAAGSVFTVGIKSRNPIGASLGSNVCESYKKTLNCSPGDFEEAVLGCSAVIDAEAAQEIVKTNIRAIVAPDFTKDAMRVFSEHKDLRLVAANRLLSGLNESFSFDDGLLVQTPDTELFTKWRIVTATRPSQPLIDAMAFGMMIAMPAKSDCAIVINDDAAVGIASGHTNKIRAVLAALENARETMQTETMPSRARAEILASDSALPFDERIKKIAEFGIKAVIQTGGHKTDGEFIDFCNENGISMIFTGIRHLAF